MINSLSFPLAMHLSIKNKTDIKSGPLLLLLFNRWRRKARFLPLVFTFCNAEKKRKDHNYTQPPTIANFAHTFYSYCVEHNGIR